MPDLPDRDPAGAAFDFTQGGPAGVALGITQSDLDEMFSAVDGQQGVDGQDLLSTASVLDGIPQIAGIEGMETAGSALPPPPPAAGGPAFSGVDQTLSSATFTPDLLPEAIDLILKDNQAYLIFTPANDPKKLEFGLYLWDGANYIRYDPVVNGTRTRVPPGLISRSALEATKQYFGVARYLKMFGLALDDRHMVPNPRTELRKPFAVKITQENREFHDRLILARLCGVMTTRGITWHRPERSRMPHDEFFNANIGFVEWAMLPYNQTENIKTLLTTWDDTLVPNISVKPDRNAAFVFDIKNSELEVEYSSADVDLVTTIVPPQTSNPKKRRIDGGPAATNDKGVSFTEDREPKAAPPPQGAGSGP